jgi:DNA-binding NarL/FixJ family response regulator
VGVRGRRHQIARQRDPFVAGHADGQLLDSRMQMPPVGDQAEDDPVVEEKLGNRSCRAGSDGTERVPDVRGKAGPGVDSGAGRRSVRKRVADRGHHAGRRDSLDRLQSMRKLRREGHETSPPIRKPAVEGGKIDWTELVDRDRTRSLRIEKRALEVEADAALVRQADRGPRRQEVARDAAPDKGFWIVDVEVDEARKDMQVPFQLRRSLDRDDATRLDPDDARVRAVEGVDQEPGNRSHLATVKFAPLSTDYGTRELLPVPDEITCLIADDHEVVREGLRLSLSRSAHIRVIGEASDGASAIAIAERRKPNVVIMDVRMPGMDGLEATKILSERLPATNVLIFTAYGERSLLGRGLESGAKGYILKEAPHSTLLRAIEKVASGEGYVDPALMPDFLTREREEMLTVREREILQLLADGMSNADVAAKLFISQETVKSHVRHILAKLEADTRTHAVAIALREAIID